MQERGGDIAFLDGRVQLLFLATYYAVDEICPVVPSGRRTWTRFLRFSYLRLVAVVAVHGHVAVGAVEDVANRVQRPLSFL